MIPIIDDVPLERIREEAEAFDFLEGVRELVLKSVELHGSDMYGGRDDWENKGNDSEYCFVFWLDPNDEQVFVARVRSNIEELDRDGYPAGWNFDVNWNGTGLVFVRTWL